MKKMIFAVVALLAITANVFAAKSVSVQVNKTVNRGRRQVQVQKVVNVNRGRNVQVNRVVNVNRGIHAQAVAVVHHNVGANFVHHNVGFAHHNFVNVVQPVAITVAAPQLVQQVPVTITNIPSLVAVPTPANTAVAVDATATAVAAPACATAVAAPIYGTTFVPAAQKLIQVQRVTTVNVPVRGY